jgi:chemotaxis protein methyltransferase CheR
VTQATATQRKRSKAMTPGDYMLTTDNFRQIADTLNGETGIYLSDEKAPLVYSRLGKRLKALGMSNFTDYCALIISDKGVDERMNMMNALTTNVTRFFREPHHFDTLKKDVLPKLLAEAKRGGKVRIWSAACSSGEEPYSIALTVLSLLPDAHSYDIKILATDVDKNILHKASEGVYRDDDVEIMPDTQKRKYFEKADRSSGTWVAGDELKRLITFRQLNLIKPWPISSRFDIIFCRNVVIYFQETTQQELWTRFHKAIEPKGWLFIGHSERITGPASSSFKCEGFTSYQRLG